MRNKLRRRQLFGLACAIGLAAVMWSGIGLSKKAAASSVTAIDILLELDATMLGKAETTNARLLKAVPKGFALDETHRRTSLSSSVSSAQPISTKCMRRPTRCLPNPTLRL